jgi:tripartite-type tricarboxylate transporter receptor subunit TctC
VHPALPVKSVKELIAYMKSNPGKLNYGSPAPSSANNLEMQMFMIATGTNAQQVNYKGGAGPAMIGLLANEVQTMFVTFSSAVTYAKSGRVRMLATVSPERIPAMPDVPTMREQGLNMVVGSWQGIYVPKGTPAPVTKRLFDVTQETMKHADVVKRMGDSGVTIVVSKSSDEFAKFWKSEHDRFAKVIRDAKIPTE